MGLENITFDHRCFLGRNSLTMIVTLAIIAEMSHKSLIGAREIERFDAGSMPQERVGWEKQVGIA